MRATTSGCAPTPGSGPTARPTSGSSRDALAQRGAGRGEIVLATTHNTPDHLFMWLGLMVLGVIFVPVNPRSSEAELAALVEQVTPKLVLGDEQVAALAQAFAAAPQPPAPRTRTTPRS